MGQIQIADCLLTALVIMALLTADIHSEASSWWRLIAIPLDGTGRRARPTATCNNVPSANTEFQLSGPFLTQGFLHTFKDITAAFFHKRLLAALFLTTVHGYHNILSCIRCFGGVYIGVA